MTAIMNCENKYSCWSAEFVAVLSRAGTCTQGMTQGLTTTWQMMSVPAAVPRARRAAMWCTQESMTKPPGHPFASLQQQNAIRLHITSRLHFSNFAQVCLL